MNRKKIAFLTFTLNLTGGTVNAIEYATGLRHHFSIESLFVLEHPSTTTHDANAHSLVSASFSIVYVRKQTLIEDLNQIYVQGDVYAFYLVTSGSGPLEQALADSGLPVLVHMTGVGRSPWGLAYAYVSEWMSEFCSRGELPFVPHVVQLPSSSEDLRQSLNIPSDVIVVGRLGGGYSWNIHFVNNVIHEVVELRSDIYFLLVNVPFYPQFFNDPKIKVFSSFPYDQVFKRKFINTCDAMIHARAEGESFGFAPAEFSISNKPVITYAHSTERAHIRELGKRGVYYESPDTLRSILLCIGKGQKVNWNCYESFDSESVTRRFYEVFLGDRYNDS
jgi:hypothetical protein